MDKRSDNSSEEAEKAQRGRIGSLFGGIGGNVSIPKGSWADKKIDMWRNLLTPKARKETQIDGSDDPGQMYCEQPWEE